MSLSNDAASKTASSRMRPAVTKMLCCSVTAATGFIAAYVLVVYAISLAYEAVWILEAQSGLPLAAALLMACYIAVMLATLTLVHGLISKNNTCLMVWLVVVLAALVPECALVFYMSVTHWGLQGVYGGAELVCYAARLPGVVAAVVLVQSAYALRTNRVVMFSAAGAAAVGSEFDASHYVPDQPKAFTNDAFLADNGKPGSLPDLRRHLSSRQSIAGYPPMMLQQPPPAYWQHLAEKHYATTLQRQPKHAYGTWMGPRTRLDDNFKRRHSVVGAFNRDEFPIADYNSYPDDKMDCRSEIAFPYYKPYPFDPRFYPPDYYPDYKCEETYGGMLRHEPYYFSSRERVYFGPDFRNSHVSVGNESDDFTKYKDVAL